MYVLQKIKPFFLVVDIQHNQCQCRFFNPREKNSVCGDETTPQRHYIVKQQTE